MFEQTQQPAFPGPVDGKRLRAVLETNKDLLKEAADHRRRYLAEVPETVAACVQAGVLAETSRRAAAEKLASHPAEALLVIQRLAKKAAAGIQVQANGAPADIPAPRAETAEEIWDRTFSR